MRMKVLLLGATGNLGSRLVPALLTHGHTVVVFVRSSAKLESLFPEATRQQLTVVEGDATDSAAIKEALLTSECDAVVNAAGVAAMAPWGKSDLPEIFRAVLEAVQEAGVERKRSLRVWFMGGMSVLNFPGTESMISNYMPVYLTHRQNLALLKSLPSGSVDWSLLCPTDLVPESTDLSVPTKASEQGKLVANTTTPPLWKDSWLSHIPLIGKTLVIGMNFSRYESTLEQNAEFIANDLEAGNQSPFIGSTVGVIDPAR